MADEVLRLGIDPRPAAQGAREYRRATEDVSKAATQAAAANDQLDQATKRLGATSTAAARTQRQQGVVSEEQLRRYRATQASLDAVERATKQAERAERAYQETLAHTKIGAARGIITPEQAAQEGREAAMAYNRALATTIDTEGALLQRTRAGKEAFVQLAGGLKDTEEAAQRSSLGMARLNNATASLARQVLGVHPVFATAADTIGSFAIGTTMMTGVFLGLAGAALLWRELGEEAREAARAQEEALERLEQAATLRAQGREGTLPDDIEQGRKEIEDLERRKRAILETIAAPTIAGVDPAIMEFERQGARERLAIVEKEIADRKALVQDSEDELLRIRVEANNAAAENTQNHFDRTGEAQKRAGEEAAREAKRQADEEARATEERVKALDAMLHQRIDDIAAGREEMAAREAIIEASKRERWEVEAMLAAKKAGAAAERELTVALAGIAAVRDAVNRGLTEGLDLIAADARAKAEAILATHDLAAAEQRLEQQRKAAAAAADRRRDYLIGAGVSVATQVAGSGVVGGVIGGAISGGLAGSAVPGIGTAVGAVIGATTALVTGLITQSQRAREEAKRAEEAKRQLSLNRENFYDELAARELEVAGLTEQAEAFRLEIEQRKQLIEIQKLDLGWKEEEVVARVNALHAAERAIAAAERAAEAEKKLAEERERATRAAEDMYTRGLLASGQDVAAARAGQVFSQRREMADAPEVDREALGVLHEMERNQLELNIAVDAINQAAQEQIDRLDQQIAAQEKALQVAQEQLATHERALEEARRVVEALGRFRDSLKLGPLSILSPHDRLAEARQQFEGARRRAMGGDADAAAELPAAAQALLEASREFNASGSAYVADFEAVQDALEAVQGDFADREVIEEAILKELQRQTAKQERLIAEAQAQQDAIREKADEQIAAQHAEFMSKQTALWDELNKILKKLTDGVLDVSVENFPSGDDPGTPPPWYPPEGGEYDPTKGLRAPSASSQASMNEPIVRELQTGNVLTQAGFQELLAENRALRSEMADLREETRRMGELIGVRL